MCYRQLISAWDNLDEHKKTRENSIPRPLKREKLEKSNPHARAQENGRAGFSTKSPGRARSTEEPQEKNGRASTESVSIVRKSVITRASAGGSHETGTETTPRALGRLPFLSRLTGKGTGYSTVTARSSFRRTLRF